MISLPPKYGLAALLIAAVTIRCSPLPPRHAEPVLERGLFDSVGSLFDKAKTEIGNVIGIDNSNRTPTLPVAKDVFAELTKGALYSNAAYCSATSVKTLTCGATCEALGNIEVAFTGGDNQEVPACKWKSHLPKAKITVNHIFSNQFSLHSIRRFKVLWLLRRVLSQLSLCHFSRM